MGVQAGLRFLRTGAALLLVLAVAGVGVWVFFHFVWGFGVRSLLASPLPEGGVPTVGVEYRIDISCTPAEFEVGDTVWTVVQPALPPIPMPEQNGGILTPIPGVVRLTSDAVGVFVSDVDGLARPIRFLHLGDRGFACLG